MADISMCNKALCPKSGTCYRFNAVPSLLWQSYGGFIIKDCTYYWSISKEEVEELKLIKEKIKENN